MNTKNIGLNGTNKVINDIERRAAGIQVEYDYYSTGFEFTSAEPHSANHIFGNGKWKKQCVDAFGETYFQNHCDKYGNKPIDFKIVCLNTAQAPYFAHNETIQVNDKNNLYSGTHKVLALKSDGVCIMVPFKGNSNGTIVNQSRKQGAEKALKKNMEMLKDLKPNPTNTMSNVTGNESSSDIANDTENAAFWNAPETDNKKIIKAIAIIGGSIILIVAAYYIYKKYKKN